MSKKLIKTVGGAPVHTASDAALDRLIARCKALPPTPCAVAHPCDESSLRDAVDAAHSEASTVTAERVPFTLTSRADSLETRLASCAGAALVAKARREDQHKAVA